MSVFVKVAKLGSIVKEVILDDGGATVGAAVAASGEDATGFEMRVQGRFANNDTAVANNDIIILAPAIKGGV